jgi:hypothetical protein
MRNTSPIHSIRPPGRAATSLAALLCLTAAGLHANGLDQHLVARWTFNDGTLKADHGGHVLERTDFGSTPGLEISGGQARLKPGTLLVSPGINSTDKPELKKALTIWVRVKFETPLKNDAFLFGLRNQTAPGEWKTIVFTALGANGDGTTQNRATFISRLHNQEASSRSSSLPEIPAGEFHTLALVFDGAKKTSGLIIDDTRLEHTHRDATSLDAFDNFAIGRLKASSAPPPMVIEEIRIYAIALTLEWIAEIDPLVSNK